MPLVTSKDVARRAAVSIATVSRVFNNQPNVSPEIQAKVLRAAEELNYRPNRVAQRLRAHRSLVVGLVISDVQNPFFTSVVRGIEDGTYKNGYSLVLCNSDEDSGKELLYLNVMLAESVAGVILAPTQDSSANVALLLENRIPVIAIDRQIRDRPVDCVRVDSFRGAFQAVSHLIAQGHSRIGMIDLPLWLTPGVERRNGYLAALQAHGIAHSPARLAIGDAKPSGGYASAMQLLRLPDPPTALFVANNLMTLGTLTAIHELGLSVPRNLSLISFDDLPWGLFMQPRLSCVAQPTYDLGLKAAELLIQRIADPHAPAQDVILPPQLIIRDSTAPLVSS